METNSKLARESFEYIKLGKVRFIGIDAWRTGEDWVVLWDRNSEYMPALNALAAEYGTDITAPSSMMHHNGHEVDSENHFLAGRFFKADTPVPEGYDYYDVPTEYAGYAVYKGEAFDGDFWQAYELTRDHILSQGVLIPYPHTYWHAEIYPDGRSGAFGEKYHFGYMFSVNEKTLK